MTDQTVQSKFSAVGGGEIQLGITRKPITAWGGMAVFAAFCETVGLRQALDHGLACLGRTSPNALPAADHMLGFMVGVLTDASRFLHLERLRRDTPLRELFGIRRFCAPSTYTRFFQSFTRQAGEDVFAGLGRWALGLLPERPQGYTLDLDSTVLERFGEQEGVLPGYNPRRHGRPTHHPLLGGLAEAKWILHGWLRAGNAATANNVRAFMDECLALLDGLATLRLVRADNGFFDGKFLDFLEEKGLPYLVKARMTKWVKFAVLGVPDWTRVGKGIEVAEARVKLLGWTRERRLVVIRQEVATKETKALGRKLFECQGYTFQAVVTSQAIEEMDATAVYRTYNGRADFENRIKELKLGCGLEGFCMDSFRATECVLRTLCLIHNLVQHFQDRIGMRPAAAPKEDGKRHMLETLRRNLFTCAAVLGRSGRHKVLRLSAGDVWLSSFHAALARLLAPLSNCKPVPIEGPLMTLMA
jgi:Transposase DDE domain group 1